MGDKRYSRVSINKQREAFARTKGICVICGKPLSEDESKWSVDHFVPRAVYKWVNDKNIKEIIESVDNIFVVHPYCNFDKDSTLPSKQVINGMHADKDVKVGMQKISKDAENCVILYRSMKQSTLDSQGRKCASCGRKLTLGKAIMRRIDDSKDRSRDNAMCLCDKCNVRAGTTKEKRKMVNQMQKTHPISKIQKEKND